MWKWFIQGVVLLFPLVLSFLIFFYLVEVLSYPLHLWIESLFPTLPALYFTSRAIALGISLVLILTVGFLGVRWILAHVMRRVHQLFLKIPIIRKIFHASHEVVNTLLREENRGFKEVVLFPYGDTNAYAVGFLPRKDGQFEDHTAVLLPGTPNPLQGFVLYVETEKTSISEVAIGPAMKWNISIGSTKL